MSVRAPRFLRPAATEAIVVESGRKINPHGRAEPCRHGIGNVNTQNSSVAPANAEGTVALEFARLMTRRLGPILSTHRDTAARPERAEARPARTIFRPRCMTPRD